ncbi:hypothetical protein [Luteipulveratus mongoliensis]|uniref:hypothetical protein n=1 Tax=Luteipulveratus mongoliensis TaxID=571913 RepID=UPI0012ED146B|nr:hypothetical protein [Luteipulveratus mongoliensis]
MSERPPTPNGVSRHEHNSEPHPDPSPDKQGGAEREALLQRYPRIRLTPAIEAPSETNSEWVYAAVESIELERSARDLLTRQPELGATAVHISAAEDFGDFIPEPEDPLDMIATVARGIRQHGDAYAFWGTTP